MRRHCGCDVPPCEHVVLRTCSHTPNRNHGTFKHRPTCRVNGNCDSLTQQLCLQWVIFFCLFGWWDCSGFESHTLNQSSKIYPQMQMRSSETHRNNHRFMCNAISLFVYIVEYSCRCFCSSDVMYARLSPDRTTSSQDSMPEMALWLTQVFEAFPTTR